MESPEPSINRSRRWSWLQLITLCGVVVAFTAVCAYGIANTWQWGHNGYNGAAFSQAARNSLRFEVLAQAPYHTGLEPPSGEALYTHHPLMLHFHLIAGFALFGVEEWAARLVPAAYSVGALILLCLLVAHFRDRSTALAVGVLYATIPLNLIFANMVNHEQGCIFWSLGLLYCYLRWRETGLVRYSLSVLVCVTMAMQFDWAGYYVAFAVAVHLLISFVSMDRREKDNHRHHELRSDSGTGVKRFVFLVVFSFVVLLNTAAFFGWIYLARGSLGDMWGAFSERTQPGSDYLTHQTNRLLSLQGPVVLLLLGSWLALGVRRWRRGRTRALDMVVLTFLFAQIVHSLVFRKAGSVHSYWTYYLSPALAIAGGEMLVAVWRAGRRAAARSSRQALLGVTTAALVISAVALQSVFAWHQFQWGVSTGHVSLVENYYDQHAEIAWAREVAQHFPRPTATFVATSSIFRRRIELDYYLDSPMDDQLLQPHAPPTPHRVWLLDLDNIDAADPLWRAIRHFAESRPTLVWDRRFVAIDLAGAESELTAFSSREQPASVWWSWFVSPDHPPIRWVPDRELHQVRARLGITGEDN